MTVPPALVTGIRGAIVVETASASNTAGTPP
ncbi:PPE family protein [Mycobacterium tuberculosis]|nr:PPE family protein [Mycobacterium tuberculosis]